MSVWILTRLDSDSFHIISNISSFESETLNRISKLNSVYSEYTVYDLINFFDANKLLMFAQICIKVKYIFSYIHLILYPATDFLYI